MRKQIDGNNKIVFIEFLRIVACYFVLFNHTYGYGYYMTEPYSYKIWFHIFLSMFTHFNVPVFFMISGFVLLGKNEPISIILKKRVSKILIILTGACFIIYFKNSVIKSDECFNVFEFIKMLMTNKVNGTIPYWYLYSYMSFLLMLPFLRPVAARLKDIDFIYLICLHFVLSSLVPVLGRFWDGAGLSLTIPICMERNIFFPLLGYWLGNMDIKQYKKTRCIILSVLAVFAIVIESMLTVYFGKSGEYTQDFCALFDYVIAITVFYIARYVFSKAKVSIKACKVICAMGG